MSPARHWYKRRAVLATGLAFALGLPAIPAGRAAGAATCGPVGAVGGEWRSYGHDAANTRVQDKEFSLSVAQVPTLAPAWTFSSVASGGNGDFTGTPVIADGCVYVGSNTGWIFAVNADTGALVWKAKLPLGGGVNSSLTVDGGVVYAAVSRTSRFAGCTGSNCKGPYVAAFSQATGLLLWASDPTDLQAGSDSYSSPTVFDGLVIVGVSGGSAELGSQTDRYAFQGSLVILDAATGRLVKKTWVIHDPTIHDGFAGGGIWSTPAVDPVAKVAFVGAGNPFQPQKQSKNTDAVLRFDLDRTHPICDGTAHFPTHCFGAITGSYQGNIDEYVPAFSKLPCVDIPGNPPPSYPQGLGQCGDIDLDFGAAPNLFTVGSRHLVGAGQKSGVYHVFDANTMKPVWKALVGPPTPVGGIVGSTAYDGQNIYGPVTVPGHVWSVGATNGGLKWLSPTLDAVHWGNPVSVAYGIAYTVDLKGFLDAYDTRTGLPLLHRPMALGSSTGTDPVASWGGVSIARNTVYAAVGISGLSNGFVIAFRPGGGEGGLPVPPALPGIPAPPGVGSGTPVVAGPGGQFVGYATPVVTVAHGGSVTFTNLDVPQHDVQGNGFGTALLSTGQSAKVTGVESLAPGSYQFYCSLHRNMVGTLTVT